MTFNCTQITYFDGATYATFTSFICAAFNGLLVSLLFNVFSVRCCWFVRFFFSKRIFYFCLHWFPDWFHLNGMFPVHLSMLSVRLNSKTLSQLWFTQQDQFIWKCFAFFLSVVFGSRDGCLAFARERYRLYEMNTLECSRIEMSMTF